MGGLGARRGKQLRVPRGGEAAEDPGKAFPAEGSEAGTEPGSVGTEFPVPQGWVVLAVLRGRTSPSR